ncbi:hypothetical protein GWK47_019995 [Chionoecetes opilio]|uniref:Uncharacterized protein n=1 Tax=Chionoecetes opilio TaxID=41210 RepID=A0A8J4XTQ2_CHIOP|nr:hypothetical protein GWK47_019995 [Chionoecetes opilio]
MRIATTFESGFVYQGIYVSIDNSFTFLAATMSSGPGAGEYEPLADRPLFGNGEARPRERMVNAAIICVTSLLVFFTTISAFVSGSAALDLFFVACIISSASLTSH